MIGIPRPVQILTDSHDHGQQRQGETWLHVHTNSLAVGMPPGIGTAPEIVVMEVVGEG
jgi:hypothetical protein